MRVLMVEDDSLLGSAVHRSLGRVGYAVDWIKTGAELAVAMQTHHYGVVLIDLGLPDVCGETLVKRVRARSQRIPVVVMTARGAVRDRVSLLDIGADDYLVKPFDLDELSARLRAVTRRAPQPQQAEAEIAHGPLKLQPTRRTATWHGEAVRLGNKEYVLLELFVRRRHRVLSRTQLEQALYGHGDDIGSNAVEVYISFLRRKFGAALIQTVRGVGYQLGDIGPVF